MVTVTAPEGSMIAVDGTDVGKAPLSEPIFVDAGKHTFTATDGATTATKAVDVAEEGRVAVDLGTKKPDVVPPAATPAATPTIAPASPPAAAPATTAAPQPAASPSSGPSTLKWVGYGGAGLLAVGSVIFAVQAASSASELDDKKRELGVTRSSLDDLQGDGQRGFALSVAFGVSAVALAAVTFFVSSKKSGESAQAMRWFLTGNARGGALGGTF